MWGLNVHVACMKLELKTHNNPLLPQQEDKMKNV